jgi:hypothetical protein
MEKCDTKNCDDNALNYVYWPGQGKKKFCKPCTIRAIKFSEVLGFDLHNEEIIPSISSIEEI